MDPIVADFRRRKKGRTVSERRVLAPAVAWDRLETTEEDWDAADAQLLTAMWSQLVLIRSFEEYLLEMAAEGLVHGPPSVRCLP
jgi:2-oxoisovalerate dehydrogenase E1 component